MSRQFVAGFSAQDGADGQICKTKRRFEVKTTGVLRTGGPAGAKVLMLAAAAVSLSACMGAPTYGTDKPADQQLLEDLTGVLSLGPKDKKTIQYKPRPELVKPASTASLPAPQDDVVTASNPAWPESPEQRRERIRAEASIGSEAYNFEPEVVDGAASGKRRQVVRHTRGDPVDINGKSILENTGSGRKEFNRRLAENNQGSPTNRKYLSEPPLDYRAPAASAPAGDVGEDEWRKKKRREQGSTKGSWSLRDLVPW